MDNKLGDKIEILGFSDVACSELRKCGIDSVQDLMLLINAKLLPKQELQYGYNIGLREAILNILKKRPNEILNCDEIREALISEYGNGVSSNIGSIRSTALSMAYSEMIERTSAGQYFYASNSQINKLVEKSRPSNQHYISLKEAVPEVLKTIPEPFDFRVVRDRLERRFGKRVSTKKSSIKTKLNELLREGIIERTETGDYVRKLKSSNARTLDMVAFDLFLHEHIGKEIEFRYKTDRPNSDRRWRRETLWKYDNTYFYVEKTYSFGHHVLYRKERVVEYREMLE